MPQSFAYSAQHADGASVRGTIDATDLADAERMLRAMQLNVLTLDPVAAPRRPVRLGTGDLQTFNELLLQISRAGLPVEAGLASLSGEIASGKLKRAIDALVADLQSGVPLETAVGRHRGALPPLYGHLIDAGIRSADLPAVLGRFGRHLQTVSLLRDALWRACAYPATVFAALLALLTFLGYGVLPRYFELIRGLIDGKTSLSHYAWYPGGRGGPGTGADALFPTVPWVAIAVEWLGRAAPFLVAIFTIVGFVVWMAYRRRRVSGDDRGLVDALLRFPLIGRAMRDSYVASWLDVAAIAATAGLDLPQALRLAGEAVALPSLRRDGEAIAAGIESGRPADTLRMTRLPATVPLAIEVAAGPGQLARTLGSLAGEYQQQAERQIRLIPGRVMPLLLVAIGALALVILYSIWMPMAELLRVMTSF